MLAEEINVALLHGAGDNLAHGLPQFSAGKNNSVAQLLWINGVFAAGRWVHDCLRSLHTKRRVGIDQQRGTMVTRHHADDHVVLNSSRRILVASS